MRESSNRIPAALTAMALIAALGAPAYDVAYGVTEEAPSSESSTVAQNTSEQASETSVPDNENPQSDGINEEEASSLASMVRTASSTTEALSQDARAVPSTVAAALGIAAIALVFVAFKAKA